MRAILHTTGLYSRGIDYTVEVADPAQIDMTRFPDETFAITFYNFFYTEIEEGGVIYPLKSDEFNPSPVIFLKGRLMDRQAIAEDYPDMAANIIKHMNDGDLNYTVLFAGKFKPFGKSDIFWSRTDHQLNYYNNYGRRAIAD